METVEFKKILVEIEGITDGTLKLIEEKSEFRNKAEAIRMVKVIAKKNAELHYKFELYHMPEMPMDHIQIYPATLSMITATKNALTMLNALNPCDKKEIKEIISKIKLLQSKSTMLYMGTTEKERAIGDLDVETVILHKDKE